MKLIFTSEIDVPTEAEVSIVVLGLRDPGTAERTTSSSSLTGGFESMITSFKGSVF